MYNTYEYRFRQLTTQSYFRASDSRLWAPLTSKNSPRLLFAATKMIRAVTSPNATTTAITNPLDQRPLPDLTQSQLTNENNHNPCNLVHLVLVDIVVDDTQQVTRHRQPVIEDLDARPDLQIIPDGFVQRQERRFGPEELGRVYRAAVSVRTDACRAVYLPRIPLLKLTSIRSLNNLPVIFNASLLDNCSSPVVASSLGNEAVDERESCMTDS